MRPTQPLVEVMIAAADIADSVKIIGVLDEWVLAVACAYLYG